MCALLVGVASGAGAQIASGNIYGTVVDEQGGVLPGVDVSLVSTSIGGAPRTTVTDSQGQFRFLNLDPGTYKLTTNLPSFSRQEREVIVTTGVNVYLSVNMKLKSVEETITVTAETPVVDIKKVGTATTLTQAELEGTPQSKDPWAMLKTVPGVIVDRVNVGGNESGQQSGFIGKGTTLSDTMWNLDGVVITDVTSGGASSSYYDFNAFDEVNVSTGGNDLRQQTGGIGINFVTRRGTNQFKGTIHGSLNNHNMEASNLPAELKGDARLRGANKANHTNQITDVGFDVGGPIVKDKLWFWGSYGKQDIRIIRLAQTFDRTLLKNTNAKVNWAATQNDQVSFFYFNGAKEKFGRSPGVAATEPDSFLWNQGNFYPETGLLHPLHGLWKVEDNHVFGPNLFVNAKYAWYGWGYGFAPRGGAGTDGGVDYDNDIAYGSYVTAKYTKSWHLLDVSGSAFANTGGASHEFKFGFGYNRRPSDSLTRYSGSQVFAIHNAPGDEVAQVWRERNVSAIGQYTDLYFGDTISKGSLTVNAGVRWDRQTAKNLPSVAQANPLFPNLLPTLSYDGAGPTINWNNISPRVGMTYALDQAKKTLLRASYARYAGQLNPAAVTSASPVGSYYTYIAYKWIDLNGDHFAQKNEILTNLGPLYAGSGIDLRNPGGAPKSPNDIAAKYHSNKDDEVVIGLDKELIPNLMVGVAYTYHRSGDLPNWNPRIGLTSADYAAGPVVTSKGYSGRVFIPNQAKVDATGGGRLLTNRLDYNTTYNGFEASLNKRLSNKWFARVAFSYNNFVEHYTGPGAVQNPTRTDTPTGGFLSGPQVDGGQYAPRSGGSGKGDIFYNAKWQINANGLYQLPMGFEVATNVFGRQGYVRPFVLRLNDGADGPVRVLTTPTIDATRYPNLWDVDFRVAKNIHFYGPVTLNLAGDLFNAFNTNTELARNRQANSASFGVLNEIIAPRILRISARFQF
jgi:hypothetical protein